MFQPPGFTASLLRLALSGAFSSPASKDVQGRGIPSVVVGLYDDLHVLIEGDEDAQKTLQGKLAEVAAQHLGDIGSWLRGLKPG